ncbi:unnamed protein product [Owenia fusiformis]|uniref:Uncharacterized protein n=1 Tax=Owenia fusiformis TaxID=6347 RepID=A0A8J1UK83_OWEFU|nr:unnamed protein product [Owenia fusiformis]
MLEITLNGNLEAYTADYFPSRIYQNTVIMYKLALIVLLAAAAMADVPSFCNRLDCPRFKVLRTTDDYEVREYEESRWASTDVYDMDFSKSGSIGFRRVFNYIAGNNAANAKIPMTAPVLRTIIPGQGPACESNFTTSFYQPFNMQKSGGPAPSDADVYLSVLPKVTMYVRSFSGYATEEDYLNQATQLAASINNPDAFRSDLYYTAGYDSPYKFFNRHNEILFRAK